MDRAMVVRAVVMMQQNNFAAAIALVKRMSKEEQKMFNELHKSKLSGSLFNQHGRESKDNRQFVRHETNGPAKIRGAE